MRILYTADLQGNPSFYKTLFTLAVRKKAGVTIVGGNPLLIESAWNCCRTLSASSGSSYPTLSIHCCLRSVIAIPL